MFICKKKSSLSFTAEAVVLFVLTIKTFSNHLQKLIFSLQLEPNVMEKTKCKQEEPLKIFLLSSLIYL